MLREHTQEQMLREHTQEVITGLGKRNFKEAEGLVTQALEIDKLRRETQTSLDTVKANLNADSKKIGELMKTGKADEAAALRAAVAASKDKVKTLEDSLADFEKKQQDILYKINRIFYIKSRMCLLQKYLPGKALKTTLRFISMAWCPPCMLMRCPIGN